MIARRRRQKAQAESFPSLMAELESMQRQVARITDEADRLRSDLVQARLKNAQLRQMLHIAANAIAAGGNLDLARQTRDVLDATDGLRMQGEPRP